MKAPQPYTYVHHAVCCIETGGHTILAKVYAMASPFGAADRGVGAIVAGMYYVWTSLSFRCSSFVIWLILCAGQIKILDI